MSQAFDKSTTMDTKFKDAAKAILAAITQKQKILIITHIDADGITAASILVSALRSLGFSPEVLALRQLDEHTALEVSKKAKAGGTGGETALIFTDMGSGQPKHSDVPGAVIIDHHTPVGDYEFKNASCHLNAHLLGIDGSREASASTLSFFVAKELLLINGKSEEESAALIPLAVTGAVGDMQCESTGLTGFNRELLSQEGAANHIRTMTGLGFFGRETRPLNIFLEYASDPYIPGLSGQIDACNEFIKNELAITTTTESHSASDKRGTLPAYHDLSAEQQKRLITALHIQAIRQGLHPAEIKELIKEYYIFPREATHTEMRDATEFSTLLNACARNDAAGLAIRLCLGERGVVYEEASMLLARHRAALRDGMIEAQDGIIQFGINLQYYLTLKLNPAIVGVVIGMLLGARIADPARVILGVAVQDEDFFKISARTTRAQVARGVNLSAAMREAAEKEGGEGGGHNIAAGARIPRERLQKFLSAVDHLISHQLM